MAAVLALARRTAPACGGRVTDLLPLESPSISGLEPLKAAWRGSFTRSRFYLTGPRKAPRPFSHASRRRRTRRLRLVLPCEQIQPRSHGYCRKCQTATVLPRQSRGTPKILVSSPSPASRQGLLSIASEDQGRRTHLSVSISPRQLAHGRIAVALPLDLASHNGLAD
jgi:hypothetical protein